ncbi:hypothetical protein [Aureibacter tunicatorum]|uniref:Membrane protein n=1 Tax=Aureibacter tunicatorum TaxID=866807 RepID=A0AAE3XK08_9BACT|nr:hypothetical protein [Aureibacter tunicatorum]MDR6238053.1 putative membrane protein [Aureibacter tunicatorum]BDD03086.1 hypothetical protein AUTU_05690 [Aureibacter tunicatorum]
MEEWYLFKWLTAYFSSMFKFVGGPALGTAFGLSYFEMVLATALGMMTSVFLITFFHKFIRRVVKKIRGKNVRVFSRNSRRFVRVWKRYGVFGISLLTPLVFTPIGGALLAVSFGAKRSKILLYMTISAFFWAFVICGFFEEIAELINLEIRL